MPVVMSSPAASVAGKAYLVPFGRFAKPVKCRRASMDLRVIPGMLQVTTLFVDKTAGVDRRARVKVWAEAISFGANVGAMKSTRL